MVKRKAVALSVIPHLSHSSPSPLKDPVKQDHWAETQEIMEDGFPGLRDDSASVGSWGCSMPFIYSL